LTVTTASRRATRRSAEDRLDAIFAALSDSTRRRVLKRLARGPATVGELAQPLEISLPAVSRHLKVLETAGLLERTIEGRVHRCRLDPATLHVVDRWLDTYRVFWDETLASLARYVEDR
jgi:DNA-binding transcriptional ArsR family regulator